MKKSALFLLVSAIALTAISAEAQGATTPAATAAAPAAPTTPPPPPPTFGAAVPGQCVLDVTTAMSGSQIGKAASGRLTQLAAVVKSELKTQDDALSAEYKSLEDKQKAQSATAAGKTAWESSMNAFGGKYDAFQKLQQQRSQEMQYTQQEVMAWIFDQMIAPINQVVTAKSCATVINSDSLLHYSAPTTTNGQTTQADFLYTNPSMNITDAVVAKLDAANIQLPQFDRANLDQQQGAGAAGGQ